MILPLTARLIAWPERGWDELVVACERGDELPAGPLHGAAIALPSVAATMCGAAFLPGATVSRVVSQGLAAIAGYVGAIVLASNLPASVIGASESDAPLVPRFAATASLPMALSGIFNFVPLVGLTLVWILAGAVLTYRSALIGAETLLRLEEDARSRSAVIVTAVTCAPVLFTTIFRFVINH